VADPISPPQLSSRIVGGEAAVARAVSVGGMGLGKEECEGRGEAYSRNATAGDGDSEGSSQAE